MDHLIKKIKKKKLKKTYQFFSYKFFSKLTLLVDIPDDDGGAPQGELDAQVSSDSTGAAGDKRHVTAQSIGVAPEAQWHQGEETRLQHVVHWGDQEEEQVEQEAYALRLHPVSVLRIGARVRHLQNACKGSVSLSGPMVPTPARPPRTAQNATFAMVRAEDRSQAKNIIVRGLDAAKLVWVLFIYLAVLGFEARRNRVWRHAELFNTNKMFSVDLLNVLSGAISWRNAIKIRLPQISDSFFVSLDFVYIFEY